MAIPNLGGIDPRQIHLGWVTVQDQDGPVIIFALLFKGQPVCQKLRCVRVSNNRTVGFLAPESVQWFFHAAIQLLKNLTCLFFDRVESVNGGSSLTMKHVSQYGRLG